MMGWVAGGVVGVRGTAPPLLGVGGWGRAAECACELGKRIAYHLFF